MSFIGVIMVLISHGHYTVDVLIAYWVTTRLWNIYHTLANTPQLKVSLNVDDSSFYSILIKFLFQIILF